MNRARIRAFAAAAALCAAFFGTPSLQADTGTALTLPVSNAPVVRVQMRTGTVFIRTWGQPQVQISSSAVVIANHFAPAAVARVLRGGDITIFSTQVLTKNGAITLPAEEFSIPSLSPQPHDGVLVRGPDTGASLVLTVPNTTAFIWAVVGRGMVRLQDYRGGAFVARVHNGRLALSNVGGDGFAEVARGTITVENSAFDRLRARTAVGNVLFANCNARQIEVSSVNGSIAYDNGTFVPGLAHFETQDGNIALGIAGGGVQVGAHSATGQIFSNFGGGADVRGSNTDAQAIVNGGGPVVTASSARGGIYLYNGAFAARPRPNPQWRPVRRIFKARTFAKRPYRV